MESSSSEESSEACSSSCPSSGEVVEAPYQIMPNRILISVASLTDLMVHPLVAPEGELYRADTVSLLFRSKSQMDRVVAEVLGEIKTNARLQRIDIQDTEVVELFDPMHGPDTNIDYALP